MFSARIIIFNTFSIITFIASQNVVVAPAASHPGLWETYKAYANLPDFQGNASSLLYEPVDNKIYGLFGSALWAGEPFTIGNTLVTNVSFVFQPTRVNGSFTRISYLDGSVILTGDVMWWLEFDAASNRSGWFARDTNSSWPEGYVFTGIAYGSVVGNESFPTMNDTSSLNGTWVCLRKSTNITAPSTLTNVETVLSYGPFKQLCTDYDVNIVGFSSERQPVIHDVLFAAGRFVAVGHDQRNKLPSILTSSDGVTWTPVNITGVDTQAPGILQTLTRVRYAEGQFVAVGSQSCCIAGVENITEPPPLIVTSSDGVHWARHQFPAPFKYAALSDATYNGEAWVAVGEVTLIGYGGQWQPILWHINTTSAPLGPPVPPLNNLLYLPQLELYYATAGASVFIASSISAGHECDVSNDCKNRALLPPYQNFNVCSPVLHTCVQCAESTDCPSLTPFCDLTGGNLCTKPTTSGAWASASPLLLCIFLAVKLFF